MGSDRYGSSERLASERPASERLSNSDKQRSSAVSRLGKMLGIKKELGSSSSTAGSGSATVSTSSSSSSLSLGSEPAKVGSSASLPPTTSSTLRKDTNSGSSSSLGSITPTTTANANTGTNASANVQQRKVKSDVSLPSATSVPASASLSRVPSMASRSAPPPRFHIKEDGTHEHHLKNAKRQEKLGQMVKDWLGAKKLRNSAVSAIPNILSSTNLAALDNEAKARMDAVNKPQGSLSALPHAPPQTSQAQPPTLLSGLLSQVNRGDITQFSGPPSAQTSHQPETAVSLSVSAFDTSGSSVDDRCSSHEQSFLQKYGECQEVIGRGAFGVVRVAHKKNAAEGRELLFAVKEFRRRPTESDKKYSQRLTNEFCISSSLKHLNIISTFDLLRDAKEDYCEVMEYCHGGDLYSLIVTAGKLEYAEADCFFKQLVRGVTYMHKMGVAHRDLKPENLLLTSSGTLKITDFGNAECFKMAWEDEISLSGGICGSSPYIAPEEYTQKQFDPRPIDVWACGVIYMAMRTGRQLWKLANVEDEFFTTYLQKRRDASGYEPIEQLKRARCRNVIYSILDPVPQRRITGVQILNSEWVREIRTCCAGTQKPVIA